MMIPKAYQLETEENGALAMACQKAAPYVAAARAKSTKVLYARAFQRWAKWCALMQAEPLPASPAAVAAYLAELPRDGKSVATIKGALAAIQHYQREAGHPLDRGNRAIASVMAGVARTASRPIRRAAALELGSLRALIARIDGEDVRSLRDRSKPFAAALGAGRILASFRSWPTRSQASLYPRNAIGCSLLPGSVRQISRCALTRASESSKRPSVCTGARRWDGNSSRFC